MSENTWNPETPVTEGNHHTWEATLKPGDVIGVRWTNNFNYYETAARVLRVNRASIVTTLVDDYGVYPVGHKITVPRFTFTSHSKWSWNNCAVPCGSRVGYLKAS